MSHIVFDSSTKALHAALLKPSSRESMYGQSGRTLCFNRATVDRSFPARFQIRILYPMNSNSFLRNGNPTVRSVITTTGTFRSSLRLILSPPGLHLIPTGILIH
mmetsp:Transcript_10441/g.18273  ORF Transcript_10441/g.18273 Transcript_10441/m.18273 type:complete len:104 (-) Transcript_10441:471-782(-)